MPGLIIQKKRERDWKASPCAAILFLSLSRTWLVINRGAAAEGWSWTRKGKSCASLFLFLLELGRPRSGNVIHGPIQRKRLRERRNLYVTLTFLFFYGLVMNVQGIDQSKEKKMKSNSRTGATRMHASWITAFFLSLLYLWSRKCVHPVLG